MCSASSISACPSIRQLGETGHAALRAVGKFTRQPCDRSSDFWRQTQGHLPAATSTQRNVQPQWATFVQPVSDDRLLVELVRHSSGWSG